MKVGPEVGCSSGECRGNGGGRGDVKGKLEDAWVGGVVGQVGQGGDGVAGRGDETVGGLAGDEGGEGAAYA